MTAGKRYDMSSQETTNLLLAVGKAQIDAMFQRQSEGPMIDDSEFMPLVEVVVDAFETGGAGRAVVAELWEYTFDLYDQTCKEVEPDSPTEENRRLMQGYLLKRHPGSP